MSSCSASPVGSSRARWSYRVFWSWAEMTRSLYSHMGQPLGVNCLGKRHDLGQRCFLQLKQSPSRTFAGSVDNAPKKLEQQALP